MICFPKAWHAKSTTLSKGHIVNFSYNMYINVHFVAFISDMVLLDNKSISIMSLYGSVSVHYV